MTARSQIDGTKQSASNPAVDEGGSLNFGFSVKMKMKVTLQRQGPLFCEALVVVT